MATNTQTSSPKRLTKVLFAALGACGVVVAGGYVGWADDVAERNGACVPKHGVATDGTMFDVAQHVMDAAASGDADKVRCIVSDQRMDQKEVNEAAAHILAKVPSGTSVAPPVTTDQGGNSGSATFLVDGHEVDLAMVCEMYRPWWSPGALYTCSARPPRNLPPA